MTYKPELLVRSNLFYRTFEGPMARGYPMTTYIQLAIFYGCGIYTAKEQGIVKRGVYFQKFWKHHYFDWTLFGIRSVKYGVFGGLFVGTILFGSPEMCLRRADLWYSKWFRAKQQECRDNEANWHVKFNN